MWLLLGTWDYQWCRAAECWVYARWEPLALDSPTCQPRADLLPGVLEPIVLMVQSTARLPGRLSQEAAAG